MTHPNAIPMTGSPMFSPWVGCSHSSGYSMWKPGMMASKGVQQVAETGELFCQTSCKCHVVKMAVNSRLFVTIGYIKT